MLARVVGQPSNQVTEVGRGRRRPPSTNGQVATKAPDAGASQTQSHTRTGRPEPSSQPVPDQPPPDSQSGTSRSSRWAVSELLSCEGLDAYPRTDAPTTAKSGPTPSIGKSRQRAAGRAQRLPYAFDLNAFWTLKSTDSRSRANLRVAALAERGGAQSRRVALRRVRPHLCDGHVEDHPHGTDVSGRLSE